MARYRRDARLVSAHFLVGFLPRFLKLIMAKAILCYVNRCFLASRLASREGVMKWFVPRNMRLAMLGLVLAGWVCLVLSTEVAMAGPQVTLTDKDNDTKQKVAQGDLLVLHLETQPGTGFSWTLAKSDRDQLKLLSSVLLNNPNMLPGGKAVQVFTFRATAAGMSDLELQY